MPHIQGVARDQVVLFPSSLDEYVTADNPVRFLDAFVDQLDLHLLVARLPERTRHPEGVIHRRNHIEVRALNSLLKRH